MSPAPVVDHRPTPGGDTLALAVREERAMAWLRLVGGLLVVAVLPWLPAPFPDGGGTTLAQGFAVLASATGVAGLRWVRPDSSATVVLRARRWSLASDALITLVFVSIYAEVPAMAFWALSLPIQGAMKLGAPGALSLGVVAASSGLTAQLLRSAIVGTPFDAGLAFTPVLPGLAFGAMLAFLASTRAVEAVERLRLARNLERERSTAEVIAHVADRRGEIGEAARALLHSLSQRTELPLLVLIDVRGDGPAEIDQAIHGGYVRSPAVAIEADGPCERAIETGESVYASPGTRVTQRGLVGGTSMLVVPVRLDGAVAGLVVAETDDPGGITHADAAAVEHTARHLGLVFGLEQIEAERRHLREEIAALQNARDQVLAIGSHELRTPLTTLVGFSELFSTNGTAIPAHDVVRFGRAMHGAATRLMRTLTDVQLADNLRRGTLRVDAEPLDPQPLVSKVANTWPGTIIHTGGAGRIVADGALLTTALERLLDNAWEHGGGIDVQVGWTRVGDEVVLWVSDGGPGVPEHVREAVTGAFVQAQNVLAHQRGTGLGLHIADGLARAMGGSLVLASTGPEGTRWELWLPVAGVEVRRPGRLDRRAGVHADAPTDGPADTPADAPVLDLN